MCEELVESLFIFMAAYWVEVLEEGVLCAGVCFFFEVPCGCGKVINGWGMCRIVVRVLIGGGHRDGGGRGGD